MLKYFRILFVFSSFCSPSSHNTSTDNDFDEDGQLNNITFHFNDFNHFNVRKIFIRDNLSLISNLDLILPLHIYICCIESLNHLSWKNIISETDVLNHYLVIEDVYAEDNYSKVVKYDIKEKIFVKKSNSRVFTINSLYFDKEERILSLVEYIDNMLGDLSDPDVLCENNDLTVNSDQNICDHFEEEKLPNKKFFIFLSDLKPDISDIFRIHCFLNNSTCEDKNTLTIYITKNTPIEISESQKFLYENRYPNYELYNDIIT